jgi:hypothetical protein
MPDIEAQRRAVVAEARTWLRTPYHHMGRVKGAGVDCATLLAEVYTRASVVPAQEIPFYPPDWHLHRNAERYLDFILAHACEIDDLPAPGDVAMWRFGKCFSHGAIHRQMDQPRSTKFSLCMLRDDPCRDSDGRVVVLCARDRRGCRDRPAEMARCDSRSGVAALHGRISGLHRG